MSHDRQPYFAYGSNMAARQMTTLCVSPAALGVTAIHGYAFRIASRGYATIVEEPGTVVHGLLWSLTDDDLIALDRFEAVAEGHYYRSVIRVPFQGNQIEAQVYRASDPTPGTAQPGYLEEIIRAAQELGLPSTYISMLRRFS